MEHIQTMLKAKEDYLKSYHSYGVDYERERTNALDIFLKSLDALSLEELQAFYPSQNKIIKEAFKLEEDTLLLDFHTDADVSHYLIKRGVSFFEPFDHVAFMSFILFLAPHDFQAQGLRKTFAAMLARDECIFFYSMDNLPQNSVVLEKSDYTELGYNLIIDAIKNGGNSMELFSFIFKNKTLVSYLEPESLFDIYLNYYVAVARRDNALLDFIQAIEPINFGKNYLKKLQQFELFNQLHEQASIYGMYNEKYFSAQDFYEVSIADSTFLTPFIDSLNNTQDSRDIIFALLIATTLIKIEMEVGSFCQFDFEAFAFKVLDTQEDMSSKNIAKSILDMIASKDELQGGRKLKI